MHLGGWRQPFDETGAARRRRTVDHLPALHPPAQGDRAQHRLPARRPGRRGSALPAFAVGRAVPPHPLHLIVDKGFLVAEDAPVRGAADQDPRLAHEDRQVRRPRLRRVDDVAVRQCSGSTSPWRWPTPRPRPTTLSRHRGGTVPDDNPAGGNDEPGAYDGAKDEADEDRSRPRRRSTRCSLSSADRAETSFEEHVELGQRRCAGSPTPESVEGSLAEDAQAALGLLARDPCWPSTRGAGSCT